MHYVSSIWTSCDKGNLSRVFKLQKRAARVISDANNQASIVKLFNSLQWLPFYEEVKIAKCCVAYKRIKGEVPLYIEDSLRANVCNFRESVDSREFEFLHILPK